MNREIKFRGKKIGNGEWMYGFYVKNKTADYHYITDGSTNPYSGTIDLIEVDPCTVGQFTGLKDRNGKEIYEGDVVFVDCSSVAGSFEDGTYKVEFILPDCMFALIQMDNKNGIAFNECYQYEVIGNIHENPELL